MAIEAAFKPGYANRVNFENYQSTINRLDPMLVDTLGMMLLPKEGIDFFRLVADRWVILVNLDTDSGFDEVASKLLGTLVINQIITAIQRFNRKLDAGNHTGDYPSYYLYVDEAGEYIGSKLARVMELKQKTGLKVTVSHQSVDQFDDENIWKRIINISKIRAHFNLPGNQDRYKMSQQFYGGEIDPIAAAYANSNLSQREAVIQLLKTTPVRMTTPFVESSDVTQEQLKTYIRTIYQNRWYHNTNDLQEQLNRLYEPRNTPPNNPRNEPPTVHPTPPPVRTSNDGTTNRQNPQPGRTDNTEEWEILPRDLPGRK